jgi:hypothetical protein
MNIKITVQEDDKFYYILKILSILKPFSELRKRELQVFAELLRVYNKYENLPEKDKNKLTFDYEVRQEIADKYGISMDSVYNIMMALRKKGLIGDNYIVKSYVIPNVNSITFNLISE